MQRKPRLGLGLWLILLLLHLFFSSAPVHAAISVLGYWRLGESDAAPTAGVTVTNSIDSAGTNNLTFHGNARYANDVAASAAANTASSWSVNFTNSAYATNAPVSSAVDNFGIECWVKPTTTASNEVIAYNGVTGGTGDGGWGLIVAANGTYQALFGGVNLFGTNPATANVWAHLALVRAGGISTLYVNGVASGTLPDTPAVTTSPLNRFALAAPPQSPTSQFFTGLIDEVRVFTFTNGQFNPTDLLVNKTRSFVLSSTNLTEGAAAGMDSVHLTITPPGVSWIASTNATWLHLLSTNGTGDTNIVFSFDANPGATRSGSLTIAGQTLTVTQAGSSYVAAGLATLVSSGVSGPQGVAADNAGNVYIADSLNNALKLWNVTNQTLTNLVSSGLSNPTDVAVDGSGNVYIADRANNAIKEWNAASGTVNNLVSPGLNNPRGVAVDAAGNVYIADTQTNAIKEWHAAGSNVTTLVSTGLAFPFGVGVDGAGNVYIGDSSDNALKEWIVASNKVITLVSNGLNFPEGLAVDGPGNVYFADNQNNAIKKWSAVSNSVTTFVSGLNTPSGVALDAAGSVYIADSGNNAIKELPRAFLDTTTRIASAAGGNDSLPPVVPPNFNLAGFFQPTSDQPWLTITGVTNGVVSYAFDASYAVTNRTAHITLLGLQISVIQGPFTLSSNNRLEGPSADVDSVRLTAPPGPWTASANAGWLHLLIPSSGIGSTNIAFSFDGNIGPTRSGTLTVAGQTLTVTQAGTNFVAAKAAFQFFQDFSFNPYGVAMDGHDNIWFDDTINNSVKYGNAAYLGASAFPITGLSQPAGMAVDGAGSVYVADAGNGNLKKWDVTTGSETNIGSPGSIHADSVAVDGAGNLYASSGGAVQKWNPTSQVFQSLPIGGEVLGVDGAGYICLGSGTSILKWNPANSNFMSVVSGLNNFQRFGAVDAAGNVWFADGNGQTNTIKKWNAVNGTVTNLASTGISTLSGMAQDREGDIFFCDQENHAVDELPRAFVDATPRLVTAGPGNGYLSVLPATVSLMGYNGSSYPTSDQPWLSVGGAYNGVVYFGFTTNDSGAVRVGHLTVLGVSVTVTQAVAITPVITWPKLLSNGSFQFGFTNDPNSTFTVLSSSNLANWSVAGPAVNMGGGRFQFTAPPPVTNNPRMFYRVRYP